MAGEARTNLVCDLSVACLIDKCLTGTRSGTRVVVLTTRDLSNQLDNIRGAHSISTVTTN